MTMVSNYFLILNKPHPHISPTTFTNGIENVVYEKKKQPKNNSSIGFLYHSSLSLPKMWPPPSPKLKRKPSTRLNNMTSFMYSEDTYTQYYLMPRDPYHSTMTNLVYLTQQMD
jgi:hypothetical protein